MMTTDNGFTITIVFPTGDPNGLRIIEMPPLDITAFAFPRSLMPEVLDFDDLEGLQDPGIYLLWNSGSRPEVYVGLGASTAPDGSKKYTGVADRISSHYSGKQFWTQSVAFTSGSLNTTLVTYIEAKLIQLIRQSEAERRCIVDNKDNPSGGHLSTGDKIVADRLLSNILMCLPYTGVRFLETSHTSHASDESDQTDSIEEPVPFPPLPTGQEDLPSGNKMLFLRVTKVTGDYTDAKAYHTGTSFIVLKGSKAAKITSRQRKDRSTATSRNNLIKEGILQQTDDALIFTKDHEFKYPSPAASVCLGYQATARMWKDSSRRPFIRDDGSKPA